jgi:hypothetical protein
MDNPEVIALLSLARHSRFLAGQDWSKRDLPALKDWAKITYNGHPEYVYRTDDGVFKIIGGKGLATGTRRYGWMIKTPNMAANTLPGGIAFETPGQALVALREGY